MRILVTGGTGYIGAHTAVALQAAGHEVSVLDNCSTSTKETIDSIAEISGERPYFQEADICDLAAVKCILGNLGIEAVVHVAGKKGIADSLRDPQSFVRTNVVGTFTVLQAMQEFGVSRLVYSSTAAVYGDATELPITERTALPQPPNPYCASKQYCERMIADVANADPHFRAVALRYFNPIGAHDSGLIGESTHTPPSTLLPYVLKAASHGSEPLTVNGTDYATRDGTPARDYLHVMDLARAHVNAVNYTVQPDVPQFDVFNISSGVSRTVLEIIDVFTQATDLPVPHKFAGRRAGDVADSFASYDKAAKLLDWQPLHRLDQAMSSAWAWHQNQKTH